MILSVSCKKENSNNSSTQMGNSATLNSSQNFSFENWYVQNSNRLNDVSWAEIKNVQSIEVRRKMFNSLTENAKARVWKEKLDALVARPQYNAQQKEYFQKIKNVISEELYNDDFLNENNPAHAIIADLRQEGTSIFPIGLLFKIIGDIGDVPGGIIGGGNVGGDSCSCSTSSDWCGAFGDPVSFCDPNACNLSTRRGCGTLFLYSCKGDCGVKI